MRVFIVNRVPADSMSEGVQEWTIQHASLRVVLRKSYSASPPLVQVQARVQQVWALLPSPAPHLCRSPV